MKLISYLPHMVAANVFLFIALAMADSDKLADTQYVDPKGYFKIVPPEGWAAQEFKDDPRGKVKFLRSSPPGTMVLVIGQTSPFGNFDEMIADADRQLARLKERLGASSLIERTYFSGIPAARVTIDIPPNAKQMQIQFILGGSHYTIVYGSTPTDYQRFLPIALASFDSFEPLSRTLRKEEALKHSMASKLRTATNLIQLGQRSYALTVINEGLSLDPDNMDLLELKKSLVGK
jgi:hypothetical protein